MFTNLSPHKLNILLGRNKIMLAARGGDKASIDVVIKAGNTGITPGPILTDFKEAGLPRRLTKAQYGLQRIQLPPRKAMSYRQNWQLSSASLTSSQSKPGSS